MVFVATTPLRLVMQKQPQKKTAHSQMGVAVFP